MTARFMALAIVLFTCVHASAQTTRPADPNAPTATITSGKIRGYMDGNINAFCGIPYGEDTAKHRFKPSVPPQPWSDVRDTTEYGPMAPQIAPAGVREGDVEAQRAPPEPTE